MTDEDNIITIGKQAVVVTTFWVRATCCHMLIVVQNGIKILLLYCSLIQVSCCKFCICTHPVNSKFIIWPSHAIVENSRTNTNVFTHQYKLSLTQKKRINNNKITEKIKQTRVVVVLSTLLELFLQTRLQNN